LYIGGACYYVIDDSMNSHTLKTFVLTKVVPNIRQRLPESTAIVLGKAVLWLIHHQQFEKELLQIPLLLVSEPCLPLPLP
jgi:hypothetical protein